MQYKTIVLELLQNHQSLHEQLRREGTLLSTMNDLAAALMNCHQSWIEELMQTRPGSDPIQLSSEALEFALAELQDSLPASSDQPGAAIKTERHTLEAAKNFLRRHTPTA